MTEVIAEDEENYEDWPSVSWNVQFANIEETVFVKSGCYLWIPALRQHIMLMGLSDRLLSSMPVKTELRPDINFIQVGTDLISLWYKRLENGDRLKSQRDHLKMKRTELQLD